MYLTVPRGSCAASAPLEAPTVSVLSPRAPRPLRPSVNQEYAALKRQIRESGLLDPRPGYYWFKVIVTVGCLIGGVAVALIAPNPWILMADAVFLAFASTQIGLLSHDVGHRQGFRGRRANRVARSIFGNVFLGLSHTWWNDKHNQHHATPNHIDMDPDIQLPMFVFTAAQIKDRSRLWRPVIAVQAVAFLLVLPLQALNMRITSIQHLVSPKARQRWLQLSLMGVHFAAYGALLYFIGWPWALPFAIIHQGVFGVYNASVFASNHKGMEFVEEGKRLDFLREQVLTSRNVLGHPFTDFWYGGLNYQIEHHLFPTMPRCNLRKAQPIIEKFCRDHGISYYATGLFASYREVIASLHNESASLRGSSAKA
jgi:fatty acid desaturase